MIAWLRITGSDNDEEGSFFLELSLLVNNHYLLELAVVHHLSSQIIEIERLSHLISELSVNGHGLDLNGMWLTWRVMVAPDSRSPNL